MNNDDFRAKTLEEFFQMSTTTTMTVTSTSLSDEDDDDDDSTDSYEKYFARPRWKLLDLDAEKMAEKRSTPPSEKLAFSTEKPAAEIAPTKVTSNEEKCGMSLRGSRNSPARRRHKILTTAKHERKSRF